MSDAPSVPEVGEVGYEYDDPDERHRKRRLRRVHETRERFDEVYAKCRHWRENTQVPYSVQQLRFLVIGAALDYVRSVEPLIDQTGADILDRQLEFAPEPVDLAELAQPPVVAPEPQTVRALLETGGRLDLQVTYEFEDPNTNSLTETTESIAWCPPMNKSAYIVRTVDRWTDRTMPAGIVEDADDDGAGIRPEDIR
jgi:hypothetical protein